jgi:nucleotide-binding universal stress UspA family protein
MYTRIFIPLDGSARSESVLPTAARLAPASGGTLILFQVYDAIVDGLPLSRYEQAAARSLAYLRETATRSPCHLVHSYRRRYRSGSPSRGQPHDSR